ncbi:MAG: hypothetical protein QOD44_3228, partial [Solirubrobacteraceae bacterium]|nr:hypothetical protein [Solirubrobacteraceae bacterium]
MSTMDALFSAPLHPINVGLGMFADDMAAQGAPAARVDWTPPGGGRPEVLRALDELAEPERAARIEAANREALDRIVAARPLLVGFERAVDVVPGMTRTTILHAGPPIEWERMAGAMQGAVTGALVFEGLARDLRDAADLAASGDIRFAPCHE